MTSSGTSTTVRNWSRNLSRDSSSRNNFWATGTTGSGVAWILSKTSRHWTTCMPEATHHGKSGRTRKRVRWSSYMLNLALRRQSDEAVKILCLGAHCDDIEIGCGGTILKLLEQYKRASVYWVVFSSDERRAEEARESANMFLSQAESKSIVIKKFTTSFFPYVGMDIKLYFERLKQEVSPDVVFTHYRNDLHQHHRLISELTWNAFRNHFVLEYEIPKYDGDLGSPNFFVGLDETTSQRKIQKILDCFASQRNRPWFTEETFRALLRIRGIESNVSGSYAEAFYCRKIVLDDGALLSHLKLGSP